MNNEQLQQLKSLALAATPKWTRSRAFGQLNVQDDKYMLGDADAIYAEAANPSTVLSLIALVEAEQAAASYPEIPDNSNCSNSSSSCPSPQPAGELPRIDPAVQGMADCMDMVRQELIEAGVIGPDVAPMFIANAVVAKLAGPNKALVENSKRWEFFVENFGIHFEASDELYDRTRLGPSATIVDAVDAALAADGVP